MVLREGGKVINRRKWSTKSKFNSKTGEYSTLTKRKAFELYSDKKSLSPNLERQRLGKNKWNLTEYTKVVGLSTEKRKPQITREEYMFQVTVTGSDGKSFTSRSDKDKYQTLDEKKAQAYHRVLGLYQVSLGLNYDSNEALKRVEQGKLVAKEEIVYYGKV